MLKVRHKQSSLERRFQGVSEFSKVLFYGAGVIRYEAIDGYVFDESTIF
jgi:predicted Ser/Thr protein kinase